MHNLVKEATKIDFSDFGDDLEMAKRVTLTTLGDGLDSKDKLAIGSCPSIGHLVNEVIHKSFFSNIFAQHLSLSIPACDLIDHFQLWSVGIQSHRP